MCACARQTRWLRRKHRLRKPSSPGKGSALRIAPGTVRPLFSTCFCNMITVPVSLGHGGSVRGCLLFGVPCAGVFTSPLRARSTPSIEGRAVRESLAAGQSRAPGQQGRTCSRRKRSVHTYCCCCKSSVCVVLHASYPLQVPGPTEVVYWYGIE